MPSRDLPFTRARWFRNEDVDYPALLREVADWMEAQEVSDIDTMFFNVEPEIGAIATLVYQDVDSALEIHMLSRGEITS